MRSSDSGGPLTARSLPFEIIPRFVPDLQRRAGVDPAPVPDVAQTMLWLQADGHVISAGYEVVAPLLAAGPARDPAAVLPVMHRLETERCLHSMTAFALNYDVAMNIPYL